MASDMWAQGQAWGIGGSLLLASERSFLPLHLPRVERGTVCGGAFREPREASDSAVLELPAWQPLEPQRNIGGLG